MLPLAGAIADTLELKMLKSGRESVCRNRNGAAFSHLGSSIGAVEVDCTYFSVVEQSEMQENLPCAFLLQTYFAGQDLFQHSFQIASKSCSHDFGKTATAIAHSC